MVLGLNPAAASLTAALRGLRFAQRCPGMLSAAPQLEGSFGYRPLGQQWTCGSLFALGQWETAYFKERMLRPIASS